MSPKDRLRNIPLSERAAALGVEIDKLTPAQADRLSENVIGVFGLPLAVAENFVIDKNPTYVPMVTEEPSVVAAASAGAKAARNLHVKYGPNIVRGQIQVIKPDADADSRIDAHKQDIAKMAGGALGSHMGVHSVAYRSLTVSMGVVEISVDTGDAMGANAVNTMCEAVSGHIAEITGGRPLARILSNLTPNMITAEADFVCDNINDFLSLHEFACHDRARATTHNKGVMNGISAVAVATGQDVRAIEAAAHTHAGGRPLTRWTASDEAMLHGELEMPLCVGTVGGLTVKHPTVSACMGLLGNPSAGRLAGIMAAVGLCQNYSALRALSTVGIQKGHMRLHKRRLV